VATAASLKRSEVINDAVMARISPTKKEAAKQDTRFADIAANTFYRIMFADSAPEAKRAELAKALTFTGTKLENRERIKEFEAFKEYLSSVREDMAKEIIKLTDTETFSELQAVYGGLNNDLLAFDEAMVPLTSILDALYTLRTNGVTFDAFKEIKDDKAREERLAKEREEKGKQVEDIAVRVRRLSQAIAAESQKKSLFGFGGLTQDARQEIARKEVELREAQQEADSVRAAIEELNAETPASSLGEYAEQKNKLRELLDITSDEHKDRQKALVKTALSFVQTANERVGSVREHLGRMNTQVENLFDANGQMNTIYAVMNEGIKDAGTENMKIRETLQAPAEPETDSLKRLQREQAKGDIEAHITMLDDSARDTMTTSADLVSQSIRIKTMKDANDTQITKARTLQTQGVAGVADRLSVVLQAVSAAALGESSAMARDTLLRMTENTNKVAQKETIRVATGIDESNAEVLKAIDDLGAYGEVMKAATQIQRQGLTEMRQNLEALQTLAHETTDVVRDAVAVHADVSSGASGPAIKAKQNGPTSPFHLGR
jgi:hypothetical protein